MIRLNCVRGKAEKDLFPIRRIANEFNCTEKVSLEGNAKCLCAVVIEGVSSLSVSFSLWNLIL